MGNIISNIDLANYETDINLDVEIRFTQNEYLYSKAKKIKNKLKKKFSKVSIVLSKIKTKKCCFKILVNYTLIYSHTCNKELPNSDNLCAEIIDYIK